MKILSDKLGPAINSSLLVDDYVPLHLSFGEYLKGMVLIRYVSDESLLEVGFDPVEGNLCSVKVIQSEDIKKTSGLETRFSIASDMGLPKCNIGAWGEKKILDIPAKFELSIVEDGIFIKLGEIEVPKTLRSGSVLFGCSDHMLQWILIENINEMKLNEIRAIVTRQQQHGFL